MVLGTVLWISFLFSVPPPWQPNYGRTYHTGEYYSIYSEIAVPLITVEPSVSYGENPKRGELRIIDNSSPTLDKKMSSCKEHR